MINHFYNGLGDIGELEIFTDGGPSVARLMHCGVSSWDGSLHGIRMPSLAIPADVLYDRFEGTTENCIVWLKQKGFV